VLVNFWIEAKSRWKFTVPGPAVGYVRMVRSTTRSGRVTRAWSKGSERYHKWLQEVRLEAKRVKVPDLKPSHERQYLVVTEANYKSRRHPDPDNVLKAVIDALCYHSKGSDRNVGGIAIPHIVYKDCTEKCTIDVFELSQPGSLGLL